MINILKRIWILTTMGSMLSAFAYAGAGSVVRVPVTLSDLGPGNVVTITFEDGSTVNAKLLDIPQNQECLAWLKDRLNVDASILYHDTAKGVVIDYCKVDQ